MPRKITVRITWTHTSSTEMASLTHNVQYSSNKQLVPSIRDQQETLWWQKINGVLQKINEDCSTWTIDIVCHFTITFKKHQDKKH